MTDRPADPQASPRIAATFRIRLGYATVDSFVEGYAGNIRKGGIFVPSRQSRDKGADIRFELLLKDGSPAIAGTGRVAWVRPFDSARPGQRSGMWVQIRSLDGSGEQVVRAALAWRAKNMGAPEADREIADEEPQETAAGPPKPEPKPPAAPGRTPPPRPGGVAGPPESGSGAVAAVTEPKPKAAPAGTGTKPEVAAATTEPKPTTPPPPSQAKPKLPAEGHTPAPAVGTTGLSEKEAASARSATATASPPAASPGDTPPGAGTATTGGLPAWNEAERDEIPVDEASPEPERPPTGEAEAGRSTVEPAGRAPVPLTFEEALRQRLAEDLPPDDAYDGVWEPGETVVPDSEQEIIERLTRPPDPTELATPDLRVAGGEHRLSGSKAPGRGKKPGLWSRLFGRNKSTR